MRTTGRTVSLALLPLLALSACGSHNDYSGGPSQPALTVAKGNPSGDAQTATVGHELANPFRIVVTRAGVPEPGATVTWQTSVPGAVLSPATSATDALGLAGTVLKLGPAAGAQSVQVSVGGAGSGVAFAATAVADAPSKLRLLTSGRVSGAVNTTLALALESKVEDRFGNAVGGVTVNWRVISGSASVAPATSVSGANGVASTTLTFGSVPGPIQIETSSQGLSGSPAILNASATGPQSSVTVQLLSSGGNRFSPTELTVAAGTTVHFDWVGGFHDVTSSGTPSFQNSGAPTSGPHTYDVSFTTPGRYEYFCSIHGSPGAGMHGTIVVQ
jgi:plastocyanin